MRLLIISHTEHHHQDGTVAGWGPTTREIDTLASLFDEVIHLAYLHPGEAPNSALPYRSPRIAPHLLPPSGGSRLMDKLNILAQYPRYLRAIVHELRAADVVHVRCPANISLLALICLAVSRKPRRRWIKYAGNWQPAQREPLSYSLQRWLLRHNLVRGSVTVNGCWDGQEMHVRSFLNPCLTQEELDEAYRESKDKQLTQPIRLLFVGRLESAKGAGELLRITAQLQSADMPVQLDVIGDGPEAPVFHQQALELGVSAVTTFHGWLPRTDLGAYYARAHFLLLPTRNEGWPKVIGEAMAYGVVPLAGRVSSIPYYLQTFRVGKALNCTDVGAFVDAILHYAQRPAVWREESERSREVAHLFSYDRYLEAVRDMLESE
jgi:glycosyltransferase involved in cell wall biosynthesis